jgi:hypothetical protein
MATERDAKEGAATDRATVHLYVRQQIDTKAAEAAAIMAQMESLEKAVVAAGVPLRGSYSVTTDEPVPELEAKDTREPRESRDDART